MPDPCKYDDEDKFHSDCMSERREENPDESMEQSNAVCYSMWRDRDCSKVYKAGVQSPDDPYEYVMSSPTVDRMGDVVEQDWDLKHFRKNPIALWNHDSSQPIGTWESVRVEGGKLMGKLKLATAGTSEMIDTIRKLVSQRVLKAVSVGFTAKKAEPMDEDDPWGGMRLSGNELLECSLCAVPANPEAISVAKSFTSAAEMLFGEKADPAEIPAAKQLNLSRPSGRTGKKDMAIAEKIIKKEEQVSALKDKLQELQAEYSGEGDIPEEIAEQIIELNERIPQAEKDLNILRTAEQNLAATSKNVREEVKHQTQVPKIIARKERKKGFHVFAAVASMVKAHVTRQNPIALAEEQFKDDAEIPMVIRAATVPADMTTPGWAAELVRESWTEFLELVRSMAVYPALPGPRVEFDRAGKLTVPRNGGRGNLAGAWIAEGAPIPVKQGLYNDVDLTPKEIGVITSFSEKVAMHSVPAIQGLVQTQMLEDTAEVLDTFYLDNVARDTVRPAGIQDPTETGAANINASTGATVAAVLADLKGMVNRLITARAGNGGVWVINPINIVALSVLQDAASGEFVFRQELASNTLFRMPIISSEHVPADILVLQGNSAMMFGNDYAPMIDISTETALVFDDTAPEDIVSGGLSTTQPVKSMFQTKNVAVRMTMGLDWRQVRPDGIQVLTGVAW